MKIAVIEHRLRGEPYKDALALIESAREAHELGAQLVIFPEVHSLGEDHGGPRAQFLAGLHDLDVTTLAPNPATRSRGKDVGFVQLGSLGTAALLSGDAPLDAAVHRSLLESAPELLVILGNSESEIQAEGLAELAIGLSDSVASLVVLADARGAEQGEPGHGGSVIAVLGEVLAEAIGDDEIVLAEVPSPPPTLQPREPLPDIPPILLQRQAHHRGERPSVEYPADLS